MGNSYTNISLKGAITEDVLTYLRHQKREAFVSREKQGITVVYDRKCDDFNLEEIESLTRDLSRHFACPALAALVGHDDVLWMLLYVDGTRWLLYDSMSGPRSGASLLTTAFRGFFATPLLWFVMQLPYVLFEVFRHLWIAKMLKLPRCAVGIGYRYIDEHGELPRGLTESELFHTSDFDDHDADTQRST